MNATQQQIIDLATKVERYRFALLGCAIGARNGLQDVGKERVALEYIRDEAVKALEYEEASE